MKSLVRAAADQQQQQINACVKTTTETWRGCVEALLACVYGPQHFSSTEWKGGPNRYIAGAEYGKKSVNGLPNFGGKLAVNFQGIADDRPLVSASKLTAAGHQVRFGNECAITHGTTGRVTKFTKDGVDVPEILVRRATEKASGSTRQTTVRLM